MALAGTALVAFPRGARATGGLDVTATPESQHDMRVLLASGSFAPPRTIDAWHFAWNGLTYRGSAATAYLPDGRNGLVNTLPLDAYLYGVLSREVSASWPAPAQEAQAIVSRTYALTKIRPEQPYDVVATQSDQVYGGIDGETVEGRAAVDATAGTILTYEAAPAHVAYGSCCGGQTAASADVWNTAYAYLPSIVDPHCAGTPGYAWNATLPLDVVAAGFGAAFARIGDLRAVKLECDAPGARPHGITFLGAADSFRTTPAAFRKALGVSVVRSSFVRTIAFDRDGATLAVTGTGHGHGVGLCQWGARVMGETLGSRDILAFYFPGTAFGDG